MRRFSAMARDWRKWHEGYDHAGSPLYDRLGIVQRCIAEALDARPAGPIRVVSMCAGEGRDLLGVLRDHPRARDVEARLVELDPELGANAAAAAPPGVEVVCTDAGLLDAYEGAVPADLVLACGVFGNVTDGDVEHTVSTLPELCAPSGVVIWTRHRRPPDLTVDIRRWFAENQFDELAFVAPDEHLFTVGMHRFRGRPRPRVAGERLFTFVGFDALT
jgi:hypothetical protein